ncbi:hypothetical protein ACJ73_04631 [Blastomyces percursus]|uniref:Carboxypeptidase n=1 Tax=Blastomyces percursus TaxID=1658174 RepID=A0A1J9R8P1_9EURO|nr:hypothetical protein ACJ73_04631 [Blastomyces percursus]
MLYIDQPVHTGHSYDELVNVTAEFVTGDITIKDFSNNIKYFLLFFSVPSQNNTFWVGTYPSQNPQNTVNNTLNASHMAANLAQALLDSYWNKTRKSVIVPSPTKMARWSFILTPLALSAAALTFFPKFSRILNSLPTTPMRLRPSIALHTKPCLTLITSPTGMEQSQNCRRLTHEGDLNHHGNNTTVNEACRQASEACLEIEVPYMDGSGLGFYDIAHPKAGPFPPPFFQGYLNRPHVQADLGVPLNYTSGSMAVFTVFNTTGDYVSPGAHGYTNDIRYLLDSGIKVALIYGDRNFSFNWVGGENTSLSMNYRNASRFRAAGYAVIKTNSSYIGGQVRQYGNFSFSRVYQAGHMVPAYQPETASEIFRRTMFNMDIATVKVNTAIDRAYSTKGSPTTFQRKHKPPHKPKPTCYILDYFTCTEGQVAILEKDFGLILDYILVDENTKHLFPGVELPKPTSSEKKHTSAQRRRQVLFEPSLAMGA